MKHLISALNIAVFISLCYVLISVGAINPTAEISLIIGTLLAIFLMFINSKVVFSSLSKEHYILFSLLVVYVGIGILTYFTHEVTDRTLSKIGTSFHFILIIFSIIALSPLKALKNIFWMSIILGAIINFSAALYQSQYLGIRAHGGINAILFGDISLLLGFMSVISYSYFRKFRFGVILPLIGLISGIGASVLSVSRGGWSAIPFLLIIILAYPYYQKKINMRQMVILLISSFTFIFITLYLGWEFIGPRIGLAIQQFTAYFAPGNTNIHTSVGARLEIWKGAIILINDYPVLGAGMGGWQDIFAIQTSEGRMLDTSYYGNIHNQILQEGVNKGLIGIFSYLALNIYLAYYFMSNIVNRSNNHEFHAIGLLLVIGYFIFGLTNVVFSHGTFNTFFVAMLALIFTFTESDKHQV
jgi:O-antigen ligase